MDKTIAIITREPQEKTFHPDQDYYRLFKHAAGRNFVHKTIAVPLLIRMMKLPANKRILEIGCGCGLALSSLVRFCRPKRLVGIDINWEFLVDAKKRLESKRLSAELYEEDVRYLPFYDESFDIVIDFGTCYHIRHPLKAIKEIARVLTVDGIFIYETRLNQLLSHPIRSLGRKIPWHKASNLKLQRKSLFWVSHIKEVHNV